MTSTTDDTTGYRRAQHNSVGAHAAIPGLWWKLLAGLLMCAAIPAAFLLVGPAAGFPFPEGGRIVLFHVPCAWLATLCYAVGAWYAGRYLFMPRHGGGALDDIKSAAGMELGLVYSVLTTVTGSIFSQVEWGLYWSWDPRQTSILVICLLFAAYVVLRGAVTDPDRRARLCAAYALVAIVPGMFLIWVLPRIVFTLHGGANSAVIGGGLGGNYRPVMYGLTLPAMLAVFIWAFQLRCRQSLLEARCDTAL